MQIFTILAVCRPFDKCVRMSLSSILSVGIMTAHWQPARWVVQGNQTLVLSLEILTEMEAFCYAKVGSR